MLFSLYLNRTNSFWLFRLSTSHVATSMCFVKLVGRMNAPTMVMPKFVRGLQRGGYTIRAFSVLAKIYFSSFQLVSIMIFVDFITCLDHNPTIMVGNPYKPPVMSNDRFQGESGTNLVDPFIASFLTLTTCVMTLIMVFGVVRMQIQWGLLVVGATMIVFETTRPNRPRYDC